MRKSAARLLASTAFAVATTVAAAHAAPITGGTTEVTLTSAPVLAGLGVSVSPLGTASISSGATGAAPVASFPITGGSSDSSGALIEHNGSGLALSAGGTVVDARNFLIDTANAVVDSDVSVNGASAGNLGLFSIGPGLTLTLTAGAASALDAAFGTEALSSSTVIGTAATSPVVGPTVPAPVAASEPAGVAVLGAGLLALVAIRRRASVAA